MRWITTIILLALIGLGIWWIMRDGDQIGLNESNPAAVNTAVDSSTDPNTDSSEDEIDLSEFEDKG